MRISILIPTRERAFYLRHCLQTVLAIADDDIEVIVSNNASTDDTDEVLAAFDDARLIRLDTGARVSMRQNFEFALGHATGDYVIYIGDDDAFIPGQFPVLRDILERERPGSLSWSIPTYGWPADNFVGKAGGIRLEKKFLFGPVERVDTGSMRKRLMQADFEGFRAPTLYHGAASRAFLEANRSDNGVFFNCSVPDVFFTYFAVFKGINHLDLHHPITISGKSAASTGAAYNNKQIKKNSDNPATRFSAENRSDEIRDVADFGTSVRGAFFQVLETVRDILDEPEQPDYAAWFRYVLADRKGHGAAEHEDVVARLRRYARAHGVEDRLDQVLKTGASDVNRRRLAARWEKAKSKLQSFRVKADYEGENTVQSAARLADLILGTDYALGETSHRDALWRAAKARARPFPKEF